MSRTFIGYLLWAEVLDRHADVSYVFNRYESSSPEHRGASPFYGKYPTRCEECLDGHWFLEKFLLAHSACAVRGTAMIRRSWWERVGGMREQFELVADVDLWMRLAQVSNVGYVQEPLIYVRHIRPDYYPDIYTSKGWHWHRHMLVREVFACNMLQFLPMRTTKGRLRWFGFKVKSSCETTKWLIYAIMKRRRDIIASSHESVTEYDLWPLRAFRRMLQLILSCSE